MAYTAWSVVFGEQPTAAKWNQLGTNDAGFKDGTNIDNLAILERHIVDKGITTRKMKPTYTYDAGSQASRQTIGTGWTPVSGAIRSYTSGATTEILYLFATCIANSTAAGSQFLILANGVPAGRSDYDDVPGSFRPRFAHHLYEIPANTTVTFSMGAKASSGTISVANATADIPQFYSPQLGIIAFGR